MNLGKSLKYQTGVYGSCIESITDNDYREALRIDLVRPLIRMKQRVKAMLNELTRIDSLRHFTIIYFDVKHIELPTFRRFLSIFGRL